MKQVFKIRIWVEHHFQQCFSYVIFIDEANWNTKKTIDLLQDTDKLYYIK